MLQKIKSFALGIAVIAVVVPAQRESYMENYACSIPGYVPSAKLRKNARYNGVVARNSRRHDKGLALSFDIHRSELHAIGQEYNEKGAAAKKGGGAAPLDVGAPASYGACSCYTAGLALIGLAWTKASARRLRSRKN